MRPGRTTIGAGGAIVMQSDPEDEFDEILLKARAPMAAIARAVTGSDDARRLERRAGAGAAQAAGGGVTRARLGDRGGARPVGAAGACGRRRTMRRRSRPRSRSCWSSSAARGRRAAELEAEVAARCSRTRRSGALLVAEAGGEIVGVLAPAGSARSTCPGATRRSRTSGSTRTGAAAGSARELVEALCGPAPASRGSARIEVGLPRESFDAIARHRGLLPRATASSTSARGCGGCSRERAADGRAAAGGSDDAAHWIREGGRTIARPGQQPPPRRAARGPGPPRAACARSPPTPATRSVERTLGALHEPDYLEALRRGRLGGAGGDAGASPRPGCEPDIPVNAGLVAAAHEGVRTAITAAERLARRRPLHLRASAARPATTPAPTSSAATATSTTPPRRCRRCATAACSPVGILDLDLHYPNGTAAPGRADGATPTLHSLHASPVTNVAAGTVAAAGERRTRRRLRRQPRRRRLPGRGRRLDRRARRRRRARWSSRSATTPSPATRTAPGASSRRSSPRSAACWPPPGCRSA